MTATRSEVEAAVRKLTESQWDDLADYARRRAKACGLWIETHDDLVQEALLLLLAGQRKWPSDRVSFSGVVMGVVRSITSHMASECRDLSALGDEKVERVESEVPLTDRALIAEQSLETVLTACVRDEDDRRLVLSIACGEKGPEMAERWGWTVRDFETAAKRLKRRVARVREAV